MAKLEEVLGQFDESNFDIAGAAAEMRSLGGKYGLSEDQLAAAVPIFGDEHRKSLNSGYTEGSNYSQIAQRAVQDALRVAGKDPSVAADPNYVESGRRAAEGRWQETQKDDDDGFGSLVTMVVSAVAAAYGVPLWVTSLAKAGFSMASGADPMDAIVNGGLSYLTGNIVQGLDVGGAGLENSFDSGAMDSVLNGGGQAVAENSFDSGAMSDVLNSGGSNVGTGNPNVFAGGTSDTGFGAGKEPVFDPGPENSFDNGQMQGIVDQGPAGMGGDTQAAAPWEDRSRVYRAPGLIESYLNPLTDWANQNEGAAKLVGAIGGGALTLAGGVGAALLNKSTAEKKIAADKEWLSQKTLETLKEAQNKRSMIQSGSYFDSKLGVSAPQATRQLRRPDGSLVFAQPGLVMSEMLKPR